MLPKRIACLAFTFYLVVGLLSVVVERFQFGEIAGQKDDQQYLQKFGRLKIDSSQEWERSRQPERRAAAAWIHAKYQRESQQ